MDGPNRDIILGQTGRAANDRIEEKKRKRNNRRRRKKGYRSRHT